MFKASSIKFSRVSLLPWDIILPLTVFLFGTLLRYTHSFYGDSFSFHNWSDMGSYTKISREIGRGIWKETHFFQSIGYPLLINWIGLKKLEIFHFICSSLTLVLMYFGTQKAFGKKAAFYSLLIGAFHLPFILLTNFTLPETIFGFLLAVCGYSSVKILKREETLLFSFVWGASFATALWFKGTHVFMAPLFLLTILFIQKKKAFVPMLIISSIVAFGIGVHGFYSYSKIGKPQFSASAGGLNFVEGKCTFKKNTDSSGYMWHSPLYVQLGLSTSKKWSEPFTNSKYFLKEGFKCIKENPFVLIQSLESIPLLMTGNLIWPLNVTAYKDLSRIYELWFSFFLISGLILFSIFAVVTKNRQAMLWAIPILSAFLCVYIFKSEARYRVPFDFWFIPAGVVGWLFMAKLLRLSYFESRR